MYSIGFEVILTLMYFLISKWGSKLYKIRSSFYLLIFTMLSYLWMNFQIAFSPFQATLDMINDVLSLPSLLFSSLVSFLSPLPMNPLIPHLPLRKGMVGLTDMPSLFVTEAMRPAWENPGYLLQGLDLLGPTS